MPQSATLPHQSWVTPEDGPPPDIYTSMLVQVLTQKKEKLAQGNILDLGPVNEENVNFFARRVKKLFVCDMFQALDKTNRFNLVGERFWKQLDYPQELFDVVILWDILDLLEDKEAARLVKIIHGMTKPGGLIAVYAQDKQSVSSVIDAFIVSEDYQVRLRPQPHLRFPRRSRHNREILKLLEPFVAQKSFIYRSGCREFLFGREKPPLSDKLS
ncbi:MAG: class I SAM-dependent methyltransferase [Desulfarculaceae bacterium]